MTVQTFFRVKICGVRSLSDVQAAAEGGADAVGLNFYPASVRYLPSEPGRTEIATLAQELGLQTIGVFVNEQPRSVIRVATSLRLTAVQLHGDETIATAEQCLASQLPVIRAVRLPTDTLTPALIDERVLPWQAAGCSILLDADAGRRFGGEGQRLDWQALGRWSRGTSLRWMLAGGLTVDSVGQAIELAQPTGVDVASGVEQPRGTKSGQMISGFCESALKRLKASRK